jgi:hypothetical protein
MYLASLRLVYRFIYYRVYLIHFNLSKTSYIHRQMKYNGTRCSGKISKDKGSYPRSAERIHG